MQLSVQINLDPFIKINPFGLFVRPILFQSKICVIVCVPSYFLLFSPLHGQHSSPRQCPLLAILSVFFLSSVNMVQIPGGCEQIILCGHTDPGLLGSNPVKVDLSFFWNISGWSSFFDLSLGKSMEIEITQL